MLEKLNTHEDTMNIHKCLGVLSLCSFVYRYLFVFPHTHTLGFGGSWFDCLTIGIHLCLSTTSLFFHVIKARKINFPMIMWEEYRLHAIVFTCRCCFVFFGGLFFTRYTSIWVRLLFYTGIMAHHVAADTITHLYGKEGVTAVRVAYTKKGELRYPLLKAFYSFYQIVALGSHLSVDTNTMDFGFNALIAIQSSAFLMTLCRKNIISFQTHAIVYSSCVFMSMFFIFFKKNSLCFAACMLVLFLLRTRLRINKYCLWVCFVLFM